MRLSLRSQKMCYVVATSLCLAGSLADIFWAVQPTAVPQATTRSHSRIDLGDSPSHREASQPVREDFAKLWDRPLRRPLYDPPPPKAQVKQLPPLRIELLGTILEDANSMAIVRSEKGIVQYKHIGDNVGPTDSPANVVSIDANAIVVEREKQRITLRVQSKDVR